VLWCLLIVIWMITGASANDCNGDSACQAGTGIGVAIIALIGFFGFVFFALIWLMSRPKNRQCPRCGNDVKKGLTTCKSCGFDFATLGQQQAQPGAISPGGPPA
jgi:hypothetical protein